jgi:ABC-2 type transport system ATP-binding protein
MSDAVIISNLSHSYGDRKALDDVSFSIEEGDFFALLGPNGGGKTTLFRILSTLLKAQTGQLSVFGCDVRTSPDEVREQLSVVFQSPSLDKRLKVFENLRHRGHLFGLQGSELREAIAYRLEQFGVADRASDVVDTLSGGLKRRVELAQCLLSKPRMLLLDEPTTGLDPKARADFWELLSKLHRDEKMTIVYTTHLFDEAEHCSRLAILDRGKLAACDHTATLKRELRNNVISIQASDSDAISAALVEMGLEPKQVNTSLHVQTDDVASVLPDVLSRFGDSIEAISSRRASLEDVYVARTGRNFEDSAE